ncbi:MAG: hypothetical protein A3F12_02265 [Gammaproteobacteria bacterium RIFCSPHIGHO2_12_FULL_38_14]|nr:MAG: hypothetical protein A3F12_02265 [Gammaproteobacteria bacterium RIFCSPHIGHO2_12_FULL_38_14]
MAKKITFILYLVIFLFTTPVFAQVKGIYLTQYTLENTAFLKYLIKHAKAAGITTFVVDIEKPGKRYQQNIALLKANQIKYVARIVMFPDGGTAHQITSPEIWQKKYRLVEAAINFGASEIQLDYIRYKAAQKPSAENSKNIHKIIEWYKNKLSGHNIPLQVDVFGITSFGESKHIGQNVKLFAQSVDAICPMVYPSHYEPFAIHYKTPYETVYRSLSSIQKQFNNNMPIKMYAYIELSNYHYRMSHKEKIAYVKAQLKAVDHADADGWYAWSPHNRYEVLFDALSQGKQ